MSGNLRGKEELKARLRAVSKSFKPIGKKWADETVKAARPKVPVKTGKLRASIRRKSATMKRAQVGMWYTGYFIDKGTVPHTIKAKNAKRLIFQGRHGTVFARQVHQRGIKARPFRRRSAEEGYRNTHGVDVIVQQWNSAGGRGGGLRKSGTL